MRPQYIVPSPATLQITSDLSSVYARLYFLGATAASAAAASPQGLLPFKKPTTVVFLNVYVFLRRNTEE